MFIVPITRMSSIESILGQQQTTVATNTAANMPFSDVLSQAFTEAAKAQEIAAQDTRDLALGKDVDPHMLTINSARATTAIEFAVELTSRAVTAYNEILKMQI